MALVLYGHPFSYCTQKVLVALYENATPFTWRVLDTPETFEALGLPHPSSFKTQAEANAAYKVPDPLITGKNLHDVAITGSGTIDGSGQHWWDWSERAARNAAASQGLTLNGKVMDLAMREAVNNMVNAIESGAWKPSQQ
mgnify:CR=1 FL=1